ncbi:MAG: hypothetical protein HYW01_01065 [Deltaproteobacteria bacterium]|nr:hypothetical protein [Deltaproteobacteria bacterium]
MEHHKYLQNLRTLEALCQTAMDLSIATHGREVPTWQEEYASHIFGKICVTVISILRLLPKSSLYVATNNVAIWDISSVSILTRSLIDAYYAFYYLVVDKIDKNESDFRLILWKLHAECERLKMLELIKSSNPRISDIRKNIGQLRKQLEANKFFQSLDSRNKKHYINGKKGIFLTHSQISENAGINPDYYKAVYKDLSNYVHTYPFSISQIALFRAGQPASLALFKPVVDYCSGYLCLAIRDFIKLVPDQLNNFSHHIIETMKHWEYIMRFEE